MSAEKAEFYITNVYASGFLKSSDSIISYKTR